MKCLPTWYCNSIFDVDFIKLKENGVKYIFTDLDNTLAPYNVYTPDEQVMSLIETLKKLEFNVIIVSNNTGKRVKKFSEDLNVEYISGAKKPFTSVILRYLKENDILIQECVIIGDQIMTDIRCANRLKCKCILTKPLSKEESIVTFVNRKIDKYLRKKYKMEENCQRIERSDVR